MSHTYFDQVFQKVSTISKGEYESCTFKNCNFSGVDFSNIVFIDCKFEVCDCSLIKVKHTSFREVVFKECKLLGINFAESNTFLFSIAVENSVLNLSNFYQLKLKGMYFKQCTLHEVDFTEADLTKVVFDDCDLTRALFINSNLEKTNFSTAYNYSIDPEQNRLKKALFSKMDLGGLLNKYDIEIV